MLYGLYANTYDITVSIGFRYSSWFVSLEKTDARIHMKEAEETIWLYAHNSSVNHGQHLTQLENLR